MFSRKTKEKWETVASEDLATRSCDNFYGGEQCVREGKVTLQERISLSRVRSKRSPRSIMMISVTPSRSLIKVEDRSEEKGVGSNG